MTTLQNLNPTYAPNLSLNCVRDITVMRNSSLLYGYRHVCFTHRSVSASAVLGLFALVSVSLCSTFNDTTS